MVLLQKITRGGTSGDKEAEAELLPALEELSKTAIIDKPKAFEALIQVAQAKGDTEPEGRMLSDILASLCNEDPSCFRALSERVSAGANSRGFFASLPRIVERLGGSQQKEIAPALVTKLRVFKEASAEARPFLECFRFLSLESVRDEAAAMVDPDLDLAAPGRVLLAASAARRISSEKSSPSLIRALERSNSGWYKHRTVEVQAEASYYFTDHPSPAAGAPLLEIIRANPRQEALNAAVASASRELVDKVLDGMAEALAAHRAGTGNDPYGVAINLGRFLTMVDPSLIDLPRFISIDGVTLLPDYVVQDVLVKSGESSKPLFIGMMKENDELTYKIAANCLDLLGVPFDEVASAFEPTPAVQVISYLFGKSSPSELLRRRENLGDQAQLGRFTQLDLLVYNLLVSFNFVTIYADPSGKRGLDFVAFAPSGMRMIVAGATTGVLDKDLQNLQATVEDMREKMPALASRFDMFAVLFTSLEADYTADEEYARKHKIVIIGPKELDELVRMSLTGRTNKDCVNYLASKRTVLT